MKKRVKVLAILFTVLLLLTSLVELGALSDIWHDYASPRLLGEELPRALESLPWWSACAQEWSIVSITEAVRVLGLLVLILVLAFTPSSTAPRSQA